MIDENNILSLENFKKDINFDNLKENDRDRLEKVYHKSMELYDIRNNKYQNTLNIIKESKINKCYVRRAVEKYILGNKK